MSGINLGRVDPSKAVTRVLFVDDERYVLDALEERLRRFRSRWDMRFVGSVEEARRELEMHPIDVVVSDVRMPKVDGSELLVWVKEHRPNVGRIVLSGYVDRETALRSLGVAHLTLAKPCDLKDLERGIECAGRFHRLMAHPVLHQVVGDLERLPTLPRVCVELRQALLDQRSTVTSVADIIKRDPTLSTKLLQVVNSPSFGLKRAVNAVTEAVSYLGLSMLGEVMLALHVSRHFDLPIGAKLSMELHRDHAFRAARIAAALASAELRHQAFSAAMLHDIGELLLHTNGEGLMDDIIDESMARGVQEYVVERESWGVTHADVGALLLGLWGIPESIVQAVALHHIPESGSATPLSHIVSIADALADEQHGYQSIEQTAETFRALPSVLERLPTYRAQAQELLSKDVELRVG